MTAPERRSTAPRSGAGHGGRRAAALVAALLVSGPTAAADACAECHAQQAQAFAASAMSRAASTTDFLREWRGTGRNPDCLRCHAPTGGDGLNCTDCHGRGDHPYPAAAVPATCARCHDAPGENTIRTHRASLAARTGTGCLACHRTSAAAQTDHRFPGPATAPAMLQDAATLRLALQRGADTDGTLTAIVRHRAGHALPGGTTGRAVWLEVSGLDRTGTRAFVARRRFGWEYDAQGRWHDGTLPPDRATLTEIPIPLAGMTRITARLVYRFRAGPWDGPDPGDVLLASGEITP